MIVGLSAAALQGAPVVTQNVDLWFENLNDAKLTAALKEVHAGYVPPSPINPPMLAGAGTELFDVVLRMDGLGKFVDEFKHSVEVSIGPQKVRVLSLDRIVASKLAAGRPKDKLVIPVLQDVLATIKSKKQRR